ncbi:MAG: flagellar hook-associated protein 2 [Ilumatobacteraceae bacterium]|nr:flagellar hook-associated protein 2 [Ilumatobacteraceae bacterium]
MVGTIDTDSIVTQLMAVERKPQDLLKTRITALQTRQNAWQAIADKLTALQTASEALTGLDSLSSLRTVSSSNTGNVTVRATGSGAATTASLEVLGLAAAQSVLASDTFSSATDAVAGRTLSLTNVASGTSQTFTSADGTIGGLAAAVNAAGIGVSARVLQTSPGQYQLALTATSTGTASAFTAGGTGWGTFATQRPAADATIVVDGVTLTRSSNVIADAIDGVELSLQSLTTGPISISSARDDATITSKVSALVTAMNALGTMVDAATKIGADASSGGPLAGDYTARSIMTSVRSAIASSLVTASGKTVTSNTLGVTLAKDGTIVFDATALAAGLASQPDDAFAALGRSVASTAPGVTVSGLLSTATPGPRTISVTTAASQASMIGVPTLLPAAGTSVSMQITTPNGTSTVTFNVAGTYSQTAGNMNAAMRAAGVVLTAVPQTVGGIDQGINLIATRYGTGQTFTVSGGAALGLSGSSTGGVDAAGTIDGTAFAANGQSLASGGLVLTIATTAAQLASLGGTSTGTIRMNQGLGALISLIGAQGATGGSVLASKQTAVDQATELQKRVDAWDTTLASRETAMRAKFTAMQVALDKLNSMSTQLAGLTTSSSG